MRTRKRTPIFDRLMARIDASGVCWEWTGATTSGYGVIGRGGRGDGNALTHRVMWEEMIGAVPQGLDLDHLCRNRACCNPDHLEPVDRATNVARGLRQRGYRKGILHCPRGHLYDRSNAKQRKCSTCKNESQRVRRAAVKAA